VTSPLVAATPATRRIPLYLPWIFAGVGVLSGTLAGYELTRVAAAERDIAQTRSWTPELSEREQDGRSAQTLFWIFGGASALALTGALVVAIMSANEPPPSAAGRE
jgi:hypothetical protein